MIAPSIFTMYTTRLRNELSNQQLSIAITSSIYFELPWKIVESMSNLKCFSVAFRLIEVVKDVVGK